ncbi:brain protein I3-like [Acanthaster planci]|uniref:Membrane protein BRI3 n=1 Tax=Acanthaster planci TaxID=133434 RepID=A0A8B7XZ51_ACAPL|nr:brain protein I3-like [Acanthaster planci]
MDNPNYQEGPEKPAYQPVPAQGYPPNPNYPPPQGYPSQPPPATQVTVSQPATQVVVVGNCPVCHAGALVDQFTTCGILLAIFFFPLGVICCLMMKERVCSHCNAHFGG